MNDVILNDGVKLPWIGLGTFPMKGEECREAVKNASKNGYKLFDSAAAYRNAEVLGEALRESFTCRDEYKLMTKLSNRQQETLDVKKALKDSLCFLGMDYVDLYLLHWPNPGTYVECYQQMEELQQEGLIRSIGVCNFHVHHLQELFKYTTVRPVVNQVELHPLLTQQELVDFCIKHSVKMVSYSPFARMHEKLIKNTVLEAIAEKYRVTVTQVIVRWNYQHGYIVIPKSANARRQIENRSIENFILSNEDMVRIDQCNENFRVRHNPDTCDFRKL